VCIRCLVCMATLITSLNAMGQGMRVSTHVFDMLNPDANGRETVVSTSLSLFHNGRVYDYVDSADQVVILDPGQNKFTVLNTAKNLSTTLSFEEMRRLQETRIPAVEKYIEDIVQRDQKSGIQAAEALRFQLRPHFERAFDSGTGRLTLSSASFTYRVETRPWSDSDQVEKYLTYADWTCRLNHLMHPSSMFPEPRLKLNAALRELKQRIPVSVELDLTPGDSLRLRAEHQFTQSLEDDDRRRISRWEEALTSESVKSLPFRSYQQNTLISQRR
jgi:hypothetical protein